MRPSNPTRWRPLLVLACVALASTAAMAKQIYQYRDAQGNLHFTDRKPAEGEAKGEVKQALVKVDAVPLVDLLSQDQPDGRHFSASNRLAGPVGIRFTLNDAVNVTSEPQAPITLLLPALRETAIAVVHPADLAQDSSYAAHLIAVPGNPDSNPADNFEYQLPLPAGTVYSVHQGFGGPYSHQDVQSYHAVDFAIDEGTPVLAARPGIVMQVESDFAGAGLSKEKFGTRANVVRILHPDGSMAVYAHLQLESVLVGLGQSVKAGQQIAKSGNTGFTSGPHLHFAIQVNRGMELRTIPFRVRGVTIPGA